LVRWSANFVFIPVLSDSIPLFTSFGFGLIPHPAEEADALRAQGGRSRNGET